MRIERVDPLFRCSLHDNAPAALEAFLEQRRKAAIQALPGEAVKDNLGHFS
jgi:hypothetical protein